MRFIFIILIVLIMGVGSILDSADLPVRLPTESELVGDWIGYEEALPYFCRLQLLREQGGWLVISYPKSIPVLESDMYKVEHWEVQHRKLYLELSPTKWNSEKITCSVQEFGKTRIKLSIFGFTNKWEWKMLLLNERELNDNASKSARDLRMGLDKTAAEKITPIKPK